MFLNALLSLKGAFAILTLICGVVGASYWRLSTLEGPNPQGFEPVDPEMKQMWWSAAEREASQKSSALNRKAAWWGGVSIVFAFATFLASELTK